MKQAHDAKTFIRRANRDIIETALAKAMPPATTRRKRQAAIRRLCGEGRSNG